MSRRNRNNREVVDFDVEEEVQVETETEPSVRDERPAEEVAKKEPGKVRSFFKKWGPMIGIGAGVALAAFIGGRKSGSDAACLAALGDEYAEDENSEGSDDQSDESTEEETEK